MYRMILFKFTGGVIFLLLFLLASISTSWAGKDNSKSTDKRPLFTTLPRVEIRSEPGTIPSSGSAVLRWKTTGAETVSIDNGIGDVDPNDSITVSPAITTTYTIIATGHRGTTTDRVKVIVITPPEDVDLGIDEDEEEGGGGLVGETIRVLNGNMIEARFDLSFSSPNRLGLILEAFYNSRSDMRGNIGYGWSHTYETSLYPAFDIKRETFLKVVDFTGMAHYFMQGDKDEYTGIFAEKGYISKRHDRYVWYLEDGSLYGFSSKGRLIWIEDATGNRIELGYGKRKDCLESVMDIASGRIIRFHYNPDNLLDYVIGPVTDAVTDGVWIRYEYDSNNNLTSLTYADGSGFDYYYTDLNDIHNLTEKRDKAGHLIDTWGYDASDRAISNFSRNGKGVGIVYTSDTQIDVNDAYGKEREYLLVKVAGRKRVGAIIDGLGGAGGFPWSISTAVSWIYNRAMNPTEVEYAGGTINQYLDYDERGNPDIVKLALETSEERVINYIYHPYINTPLTRTEVSVLGSGDKETIWDYDDDYDDTPNEDPASLISRIVEKGFTKDKSGSVVSYEYVTTFTYNIKGQVLSIDGPLAGTSDTTTFTYNSTTGDLESITSPLIGATTFTGYDAAGQAGMVTDINGKSKIFNYDGRARVVEIKNSADSSTSSVEYNIAGLPELKTDEDGVTTEFEYDAAYGRLFKRYDHEGNYIEYGYDDQGNVTDKDYYDTSSNLTNSKGYLYQGSNLPGLLYREIKSDGTYTQYSYDLAGNVASIRDPNGNTISYAYDLMDRLFAVTQPQSIMTTYTYDGHGNLQTVTDGENHTTTYEYDDMARMVSSTSPDTGIVSYAYDEAGNLINKLDAKAINVDYTYDVLNRLTYVDFQTDEDIIYTYDEGTNGIGQRTGMSDESGEYTFGYDVRGRLISKGSVIGGVTYNLSRVYTPGGRVSSITYPTGRTINFNRTACACSVESITTTYNGGTTILMQDLAYRPFGGVSALNNGAGGVVGSTYDQSGKLRVSNPGATHERTYTYDNNGNLISITSPSIPYYNRVYEYDALNRLISAIADDTWGEIDYTYDNVGNRLTEITDDDLYTYSYVTGTNRFNEVQTDADTVKYTYDFNGNITGLGTKTLNYNEDNRLISVTSGSITLGEYTYNGLGQRIIKKAGGTTTVFIYDFDGNIIGESDGSGNFSKEYLFRGSNRLAMVDLPTSKVYYYGNDQFGTPEILTDSTNTVIWEAIYKPFGEAEINPNSSVVNNFRFPGQYYDHETGLHYNYYRYYDPDTGRYLTPDPIGLDGNDINLYGYVLNNPVNETDPLGLLFGLYAGEDYGESAAQFYADVIAESCESGIKKAGAWAGGLFASLWTPDTSTETFLTLLPSDLIGKWLGRPFYQYFTKGTEYTGKWLTRGLGWKPPYKPGQQAAQKLALPPWNKGTEVRPSLPSPFKYIAGPRKVAPQPQWGQPGGGIEYRIGGF